MVGYFVNHSSAMMFQLTSVGKLSVTTNNKQSKLLSEEVKSVPPSTATSANLPEKLHPTGPLIFPSHSGGRDS